MATTIHTSAASERQRQHDAETEHHRRASLRELEERFDHRFDGLAAKRRFEDKLALHAALYANGSRCTVLAALIQAERRLQRARERAAR